MSDVQTSFVVDKATAEAIEELKKAFGVKTNAAVIRKALALARIAARNASDDNAITLVDREQNTQKIMLVG